MQRVFRGSLGLAIILALMTAAVVSAQETVALSDNASFGTILTDSNGMTLYTWQGDEPGVSNCTGSCATAWPPLTTDSSVEAPAGLVGTLGVAEQADGTMIVTFNDWPLYRFSRDSAPGDTNGHGSNGFGNMWQVAVVATAAPIAVVPVPAVVTQPMGPAVPAQAVAAPAVAGVQAQPPTATATATATPMATATPTPTGHTFDAAIVDYYFMPRNIRIAVGDSIRWTNRGRVQHTATSNDPNQGFDSGRIDPGQSWTSQAFMTAGTINYVCSIHPNMRGTITVGSTSGGTESSQPMAPGYGYGGPGGYGMSGMPWGYNSSYYAEPYNQFRWGYAGYPFYQYYTYPNYGPTSYYGYPYYAGYRPYYGGYGYGYGYPYGGYPYYPYYAYPYYGGYSPFMPGGTYPYTSNGLYGYPYGYPPFGYPPYGYPPYILKGEDDTIAEDPGVVLTAASAGVAGAALTASLNPVTEVGPAQVAGAVTIQILDTSFVPATVSIPIGGTVTFVNVGVNPHSVISDAVAGQPGAWASGVLQPAQTFTTPAFTTAGNFGFREVNTGVRGTINVVDTATTGCPTTGLPYYPGYYGGYYGCAGPYYGYGYGAYPYTYVQGSYYPYYGFYGSYPYGYFDPLYGPNVYGNSYTYFPYGVWPNYSYGYYSTPGYGYPTPYGPYYWTQLY